MPNPYQEDQNRTGAPRYESRGSHPDQYRRGDAPFQFPLWSIIVTFCVGMWPVAIAFIVLNNLLRSGVFNWEPRPRRVPPAAPAAAARADKPAPKLENPRAEDGKITALVVAGCVLLGVGAMASVSGLHDMIFYGGLEYWDLYIEDVAVPFIMMMAGAGMCYGSHALRTGRRMRRKIDNIVGDADHMYIRDIAASIPCTQEKCIRHLENCIDKGVFGDDAYLDMRTRCLVVRGEAPKPEPKPKRKSKKETPDAGAKPAQEPGAQTLERLRALHKSIPDAEMQAKIARLEAVTGKIFEQARTDPEKQPQMRKFMDYYLPTSLKLLEAYAEMEAQGIEGENISEAKRRIEDAMDTLVTAFENQLDKLFQSDALDLSTDIDVMERMLQADGLTGSDPFGLKKPEAPQAPTLDL